MERIILIETSTALCSAALAEDGVIVAYRESSAPKAHASLTAVFIREMLSERGLGVSDCNAVCVSMGPGSYTGLRVGVSTAKGLCFGAGIPLIAVGTLETLVAQAAAFVCKYNNFALTKCNYDDFLHLQSAIINHTLFIIHYSLKRTKKNFFICFV